MLRLLLLSLILLGFAVPALAQRVTLTNPETLAVPTATRLVWDRVEIRPAAQLLRITYHWEDSAGAHIPLGNTGRTAQTWICANRVDDPDTPQDETDTCFGDTFGFVIRSADVGTPLGRGLRQLLWSKMRPAVLSAGNTGTFAGE